MTTLPLQPSIPGIPVPTAIVVPVGPPPPLPAPVASRTPLASLPPVATLGTPSASPTLPSPPAPERVPAAVAVGSGGDRQPGPLALSGVVLAAGFIGVTWLRDRRRPALPRRGTPGPPNAGPAKR
jgi:hypothetical protein